MKDEPRGIGFNNGHKKKMIRDSEDLNICPICKETKFIRIYKKNNFFCTHCLNTIKIKKGCIFIVYIDSEGNKGEVKLKDEES